MVVHESGNLDFAIEPPILVAAFLIGTASWSLARDEMI